MLDQLVRRRQAHQRKPNSGIPKNAFAIDETVMKRALARILMSIATNRGRRIVIQRDKYVEQIRAYEYQLDRVGDLPLTTRSDARYALISRLQGTQFGEGFEIIKSLHKTASLDGAVCEFGVAQGETSALIAHEIARDRRSLHLFDSFEGLPRPSEQDQLKDDIFELGSMSAYEGQMSVPIQAVKARLNAVGFPESRTKIHKGFFENTLRNPKNLPQFVSFAYVDFDFYEPIKQALAFLHDVILPNGIIIVDDYDWFSTGAKTAVDEFLEERGASGEIYSSQVADQSLGHFCTIQRRR